MHKINNLFRHIKISSRLLIMLGIAGVATTFMFLFSLHSIDNLLHEEKRHKLIALVDVADSIVSHYYDLSQQGKISEEEAKSSALNMLDGLRYAHNEYFLTISTVGIMLQHPFAKAIVGKNQLNMQDPNGLYVTKDWIEKTAANEYGTIYYMWNKPNEQQPSPKVSIVKRFKPWGWMLGTGIFIDDIEQDKIDFSTEYIMFMVLISIPVLILLLIISRSITIPMQQTITAFENIANGDGDLTRRLEENGKDELQKLASIFNIFVSKTQNLVKAVAESGANSRVLAGGLENISTEANVITRNMQAETASVATAINEMTMAASEVASNAQSAAEHATLANEETDKSNDTVEQAVFNINQLSSELATATNASHELKDNFSKIGTITRSDCQYRGTNQSTST